MSKKKSKYKPRHIIADPLNWVLSGFKPLASVKDQYMVLMIRIHDALATLYEGNATREVLDVVINALNMSEALAVTDVGHEYLADIRAAQDVMLESAARGVRMGDIFVLTEGERELIQTAMDVHDAQLGSCTVLELDTALAIVKRALRTKRARSISQAVQSIA